MGWLWLRWPYFWVGGGGVNNSRLNFSNKIIHFGVAAFPLTCCCCDQIDDWEKNCKTEIENLNECERRRGFNVRSSLWRLASSSQCWWSSHLTGDRLLRGKPQGELQLWSWTPPYNHSYGILIILSSRSSLPSPSCCHQVYIFMFNIGYGSLVWMTATEILPAKIRSSTNGLTVDNISVTISFDRCPHPQNDNQPEFGGISCFTSWQLNLSILYSSSSVQRTTSKMVFSTSYHPHQPTLTRLAGPVWCPSSPPSPSPSCSTHLSEAKDAFGFTPQSPFLVTTTKNHR